MKDYAYKMRQEQMKIAEKSVQFEITEEEQEQIRMKQEAKNKAKSDKLELIKNLQVELKQEKL